jgi:hypothetical protein
MQVEEWEKMMQKQQQEDKSSNIHSYVSFFLLQREKGGATTLNEWIPRPHIPAHISFSFVLLCVLIETGEKIDFRFRAEHRAFTRRETVRDRKMGGRKAGTWNERSYRAEK